MASTTSLIAMPVAAGTAAGAATEAGRLTASGPPDAAASGADRTVPVPPVDTGPENAVLE